jgi:hypothetical protein
MSRQRWRVPGVAFYIRGMLNGEQQQTLAKAAFSQPALSRAHRDDVTGSCHLQNEECMEKTQ